MNKGLHYFLYLILIIAIAGFFQRGVPGFSLISFPVYKIVITIVSFVYFVLLYTQEYKTKTVVNAITAFLGINVVSFLLTGNFQSFSFLTAVICGIIPVFPVYYLAKHRIVSERTIKITFLFFFVAAILSNIFFRNAILEERSHLEDITNNTGYLLTVLLPFLFFFKKTIRYLFLFIIFAFVVFSAKRGAILITLISSGLILYYSEFSGKRLKFSHLLVAGTVLCMVVGIFYYVLSSNDYLQGRLAMDSNSGDVTSGRSEIYAQYLSLFITANPIQILLGHGFDATTIVGGIHAHNDWIEILFDYGIIGVLITLIFYGSLFLIAKKLSFGTLKNALALLLCIMLLKTLFSMVFFSDTMVICSVLIGYILAHKETFHSLQRKVPIPNRYFEGNIGQTRK